MASAPARGQKGVEELLFKCRACLPEFKNSDEVAVKF